MSLEATIHDIATRARAASDRLAELGSRAKDAWLLRAAERLEAARKGIRDANRLDLEQARARGVADPLVARLELSDGKWSDMLAGLRQVAALPEPVGRIEARNGVGNRSFEWVGMSIRICSPHAAATQTGFLASAQIRRKPKVNTTRLWAAL